MLEFAAADRGCAAVDCHHLAPRQPPDVIQHLPGKLQPMKPSLSPPRPTDAHLTSQTSTLCVSSMYILHAGRPSGADKSFEPAEP